jgi:hypothetical protein
VLTPSANRLVLAFVFNASQGEEPAAVPTVTGNGLTWQQAQTVTVGPTGAGV